MKINFLLLFFITVAISRGELIVEQRTSNNNVKTVKSGTNPIYKASLTNTVQVQSQVDVQSDAVINYNINFYDARLTEENQNRSAGSNTCMLQTGDNNVITGTLKIEMRGNSPDNMQYACSFLKNDFYKIVSIKKIIQVKIISGNKVGIFPIDDSFQETIIMQAKSLLNSIRKEK